MRIQPAATTSQPWKQSIGHHPVRTAGSPKRICATYRAAVHPMARESNHREAAPSHKGVAQQHVRGASTGQPRFRGRMGIFSQRGRHALCGEQDGRRFGWLAGAVGRACGEMRDRRSSVPEPCIRVRSVDRRMEPRSGRVGAAAAWRFAGASRGEQSLGRTSPIRSLPLTECKGSAGPFGSPFHRACGGSVWIHPLRGVAAKLSHPRSCGRSSAEGRIPDLPGVIRWDESGHVFRSLDVWRSRT